MSPIGPENFYRLEEFPSFISCIKCFGKPIIPPLLTPSRRHELKQLRTAATIKEAEKLKRRKELLNHRRQGVNLSSKTWRDNYRPDFQSSMQESCALWYPSTKDCQEGISVAISKLPTSGIYSSVHTGAIVCSNVIENSPAYTATIMRDSLLGSETSVMDCVECSHNNINLGCSLCQAEFNQTFHNKTFMPEISPEVPCRTVSLLQQDVTNDVDVSNDELNCTVEEGECESLPTVICNQRYVPFDTDSESNITYMTQSTDLEKYMELSCEFSSPDNSALAWESKSTSQQYTLSRSDDASSETIVNTENELTPCASTMAELTDNIEDELSNAEETAAVSDKEVVSGTLKRAHSVDSYMKILQSCAKSLNVKKSLSEPFNTDLRATPGSEECKTPQSLKSSLLIKEDSKESEDSKDLPEKDVSDHGDKEDVLSREEKNSEIDSNSFQKKHIRQNSYTLDEPSSALILAHADCTCNFDANCISPHCSALKGENEVISNSAFTKEKVADITVSQMKKFSILNPASSPENVVLNKADTTSTVIDVFPIVKEDSCEKSDSANAQASEAVHLFDRASSSNINTKSEIDDKEQLSEMFSKALNVSSDKNQEYFQHMCQELQKSQEMQIKELYEEQKRQWLKLQEEFKEQERFLYEKLNLTNTDSPPKIEEKDHIVNDCCSTEKTAEKIPVFGKRLSASNSSISSSHEIPTPDSSPIQNSGLSVSKESFQSSHSPSKNPSLQNIRASVSPSKEFETPDASPSKLIEKVKSQQLFKGLDSSDACNFKSNKDHDYPHLNESVLSMNGFSCASPSHYNTPPQSPNAVDISSSKKCDNTCVSLCDNSVKLCQRCTSCDYSINISQPNSTSTFQEQNSVSSTKDLSSDINFPHCQTSSSTLNIQDKDFNPGDFTNCHRTNTFNKILSNSSENSNEHVSSSKNAMSSTVTDLELPSAVNNKKRSILPQSSKEKSKLSVDSIVSLCTKTLKNGIGSEAVTTNKKIIDDPVLLKKFEKLPAYVKGYLTRRLFKTERVQNLIKTLQDTALLIGKLGEDLSRKGDSVSERDVDFHRQLIVQLMTTFHNVYDIFCTISAKERMAIIAESRNLRHRQKTLVQEQESSPPVTTKAPEPAPSKKHKLSSATLKALERKRRSAIDSRTYTVEDLKNARSRSTIEMRTYTIDGSENFRERTHSSMSSKNLSVSPSSIYKTSVGMYMKRKTSSAKSSGSRRSLHHKWVP